LLRFVSSRNTAQPKFQETDWLCPKTSRDESALTGCQKLLSEGVILSEAKDLLFAHAEDKADPSIAQNRRDSR